ncbi:MAG: hypothetical protein ABL904_19850 [Hyphomicrobiaceae bacterium]
MSTHTAVEGLLEHLRDWWQGRDALSGLHAEEFERIASDLGISADELRGLAARGPHSADLLVERMRALGLTQTDVNRVASGLMRELQKTCSCCADKSICHKELAEQPDDPSWRRYCPNADTLDAITKSKSKS